MFVYILISILVNYPSSEAAPVFADRSDMPQDFKSPLQLKRTLFGIIWSCISTVIICAWTSVHPNVPSPNQWMARWNRLKLMFWMIVAPELVLAWAVRQFFAAKQIRDEYNRNRPELPKWKKWTLAHGHMVGMGGFTFVDPEDEDKDPGEQGGKVLTFDDLKRLLQDPKFKFPSFTSADIQDRSKGDALWKIIAILQTSWFIIQCIARGQQGLALTELELVTLALASLNAVTFAIWWYKPLGVQEPVKIYLKTDTQNVEDATRREDKGFNLLFGYVISRGWEVVKSLPAEILDFLSNICINGPIFAPIGLFVIIPIALTYIISFPFFVLFPLGIITLLRIIKTEPTPRESSQSRGLLAAQIVASLQKFRYWLTSTVSKFVGRRLEQIFTETRDGISGFFSDFLLGWFLLLPSLFVLLLLFISVLVPFLTLLFLVSFIFTAVFGIVTTTSIPPGSSHVPSFYAPSTKSDRWSRMVVFALFGVIFGGLHCIGWYFKYPTDTEQTLWRATSLAITVIPLIVAPIDFLLATRLLTRDIKSCKKFERIVLLILDLLMTILLFIYVPARLSLIVQAFALLRNQPPSTLTAVDWTQYIPHLFSS